MQIATFEYSISFSGDNGKKQTVNWLDGIESVKILKAREGVVKFIKDFIITKKEGIRIKSLENRNQNMSTLSIIELYTLFMSEWHQSFNILMLFRFPFVLFTSSHAHLISQKTLYVFEFFRKRAWDPGEEKNPK